MKKITEVITDYVDDENLLHIDCYFDSDANSQGTTVAVVDLDSGKVIFFDNSYRFDEKVKEAIAEVKKENNVNGN